MREDDEGVGAASGVGRRVRLRYRVPRTGGHLLVGVAEQDASGALLSAVLRPATWPTADRAGVR